MTASDLIPRLEAGSGADHLSADIYCDATGTKWSARLYRHPPRGGAGAMVWERHGMRSEHNATSAMEAAHSRIALLKALEQAK